MTLILNLYTTRRFDPAGTCPDCQGGWHSLPVNDLKLNVGSVAAWWPQHRMCTAKASKVWLVEEAAAASQCAYAFAELCIEQST